MPSLILPHSEIFSDFTSEILCHYNNILVIIAIFIFYCHLFNATPSLPEIIKQFESGEFTFSSLHSQSDTGQNIDN